MPHHLLIVSVLQSSHHHYLREGEGEGVELVAVPHHLLIVSVTSIITSSLPEREGVSRDVPSLANSICYFNHHIIIT